jgi:hypothetical protein
MEYGTADAISVIPDPVRAAAGAPEAVPGVAGRDGLDPPRLSDHLAGADHHLLTRARTRE